MTQGLDHFRSRVKGNTNSNLFFIQNYNSIPLQVTTAKPVHYLSSMDRTSTRRRHRVTEVKRIHILTLREQGCKLSQIAQQTKVTLGAVRAVLHKWKQHHTIQDLPKTGRPPILDDRTKRRLARMALRGDVETATELAQTAAALDIAHISARTARRVLLDKGLKAMHTIRKPLLTRTHKRKRLDFARAHRD
ncbi:hypothetical protein EON64_16100 [archaeon]|nr:MAG: hypothetical protein EON64_16100 [archaeon]